MDRRPAGVSRWIDLDGPLHYLDFGGPAQGSAIVCVHGLGGSGCPVLLVHGALDRLVPVSAARAAARTHPSWSVVVLPGVGHVPQLEAPGECAAAITSWLGAAAQAAAGR